ncbi:signal peptidase II [Actinomycetospora sp. NBRC 106378]|uniref:signal peptidase II n=1 Tax=Actinomycetospora sp. NBRC 106378 TaxID=3032208 RepID=UPI0024A52ED3|nr:signal peptidase II [Actinomycetospora sp. NBRC 106378]GLZ53378.1 lipoprotein signal peptidase [Actinomycetospora sp. NBRC 106378]
MTDASDGSAAATDAGEPDRAAPPTRRRLPLLVAVAVFVLVVDLVTKIAIVATMVDGQRIPLLFGDTVSLVLVRNPGAAFSFATGMTWLLTLVAVAVVIGIARFARRMRSRGWAVALGLVLGGALGNLIDRFFRGPGPLQGHVVDFVSVGWWPVFNAADSAICLGGALLVGLALWGIEIDGSRSGRERVGASSGGAGDAAQRSSTPEAGDAAQRSSTQEEAR